VRAMHLHGRARRTTRIGLRLVLPVFAVVALAACGDDSGGEATPTTSADPAMSDPVATTEPAGGAGGTATDAATVVIEDVAFTNPDVSVTVGGSVTFDNRDTQAHTASGVFDTDTIAEGEMATVTFEEAGTFTYICSFHPFMKGTVTVV
jgi:plastocyanin